MEQSGSIVTTRDLVEKYHLPILTLGIWLIVAPSTAAGAGETVKGVFGKVFTRKKDDESKPAVSE